MKLTEQERDDPLWLQLKADCEARLSKLRQDNDGNLSELETAKLRGRIAEVKRLLDMAVDKPKIETE